MEGAISTYVDFPGINGILAASYTMSKGITPSAARLTIIPQPTIPTLNGSLRFYDGTTEVTLPDCLVDTASFVRDGRGFIWELTILDRRWRWKYGFIYGHYNRKQKDDTILEVSKKNAKELIMLCLEAMKEDTNGLGDMPETLWPEVKWDFIRPAEAMAEVCDAAHYDVTLDIASGCRARFVRVGVGEELPNTPDMTVLSYDSTVDPQATPDALAIITGPARYQMPLPLEAVGKDLDGSIQLIDELSYAPAAGWSAGGCPFPYASGVVVRADKMEWAKLATKLDDEDAIHGLAADLCQDTLCRWYRVAIPDKGIKIPAGEDVYIGCLDDILPLGDHLVETETIDDAGAVQFVSASVFGIYYDETDEGVNAGEAANSTIDMSKAIKSEFTIDTEAGIVQFDAPVYMLQAGEAHIDDIRLPATLYLLTSFPWNDTSAGVAMRYIHFRVFGEDASFCKTYRHDELELRAYFDYDKPFTGNPAITIDNMEGLQEECERLLDEHAADLQNVVPSEAEYAGLVPIRLDGAIDSVTWRRSGQGMLTSASRFTAGRSGGLEHDERRKFEGLRRYALVTDEIKRDRAKVDAKTKRSFVTR